MPKNDEANLMKPAGNELAHGEKATNVIHVVLDIDETLVCAPIQRRDKHDNAVYFKNGVEEVLERFPHFKKLRDDNFFVKSIFHHVVIHGTYELIHWLRHHPHVRLAIFSAGESNRNAPLIDEILLRSSPNSQTTVPVFSRNHLSKIETPYPGPGLYAQPITQHTKNLATITNDYSTHAILIDNDDDNTHPGQKKNMLRVPGCGFDILSGVLHEQDPDRSLLMLLIVNQIFYLTGLLNRIIDSDRSQTPVDHLHQLQYITTREGIEIYNCRLMHDIAIYREGLKVLQEVNPTLTFFLHDEFEKQIALEEAKKRKYENIHSEPANSPPTKRPRLV